MFLFDPPLPAALGDKDHMYDFAAELQRISRAQLTHPLLQLRMPPVSSLRPFSPDCCFVGAAASSCSCEEACTGPVEAALLASGGMRSHSRPSDPSPLPCAERCNLPPGSKVSSCNTLLSCRGFPSAPPPSHTPPSAVVDTESQSLCSLDQAPIAGMELRPTPWSSPFPPRHGTSGSCFPPPGQETLHPWQIWERFRHVKMRTYSGGKGTSLLLVCLADITPVPVRPFSLSRLMVHPERHPTFSCSSVIVLMGELSLEVS